MGSHGITKLRIDPSSAHSKVASTMRAPRFPKMS